MSKRIRLPVAVLLCGLSAGCGLSGTYPSLAPRSEELGQAAAACAPMGAGGCGSPASQPAAPPPPAPAFADPAFKAQLDQLLGQAQGGETAFRSELSVTERAVAAAGAAGSDSWAAAQVALSRLESARTPTAVAAAELDALARTRIQAAPAGAEADLSAINAAAEQVRSLISGQDQAMERLTASLPAL